MLKIRAFHEVPNFKQGAGLISCSFVILTNKY
nr:MAG TPA: hypothetical protein [Bacteriophage sp.]